MLFQHVKLFCNLTNILALFYTTKAMIYEMHLTITSITGIRYSMTGNIKLNYIETEAIKVHTMTMSFLHYN